MCPGVASSSSFQVVSVQGEEACKGVVVREAVSMQRVILCKGCQHAKGVSVQRLSVCKGCLCKRCECARA